MAAGGGRGGRVSVVQLNCLAAHLCNREWLPYARREVLAWPYRGC